MNITKKDCTSGIGLILMFALGWIANGLVDKITCDNDRPSIEKRLQDYDKKMNQRMNRYDQHQQQQRNKRLEMQRYRPEENTERPKQFRERRVRPQVHEEVPPLGADLV